MIDTNSPGLMSRSIRRSTYVFVGPWGKDFYAPQTDHEIAPAAFSQLAFGFLNLATIRSRFFFHNQAVEE